MDPRSDASLWDRMSRGDAAALGELYERHARAVQSFCLWRGGDPSAAEDAVSVVFLEVWRRREAMALTERSARPLLLGVALNVLRNGWRSKRRHDAALVRLNNARGVPTEEAEASIERIDARARVKEMQARLRDLPRKDLDVLSLVAWGDLTYEETARTLGIPVGTVRSRLSRARRKLGEDQDVVASLRAPAAATGVVAPREQVTR